MKRCLSSEGSRQLAQKMLPHVLADFLARDMLPAAYRPTPRLREHRRLVRHRCRVQGRITSLKCRIRHILSDYNFDRKDLFTREGRAYAAGLPPSRFSRNPAQNPPTAPKRRPFLANHKILVNTRRTRSRTARHQ
jgi:hypothetical protein